MGRPRKLLFRQRSRPFLFARVNGHHWSTEAVEEPVARERALIMQKRNMPWGAIAHGHNRMKPVLDKETVDIKNLFSPSVVSVEPVIDIDALLDELDPRPKKAAQPEAAPLKTGMPDKSEQTSFLANLCVRGPTDGHDDEQPHHQPRVYGVKEFIKKNRTRSRGRPKSLQSDPTGRIPDLSVQITKVRAEEGDVIFLCADGARPMQVKRLAEHAAAVLCKTGAGNGKVGIVATNFKFTAGRYWAGGCGVLEIKAEGAPKTRTVVLKDTRLGVVRDFHRSRFSPAVRKARAWLLKQDPSNPVKREDRAKAAGTRLGPMMKALRELDAEGVNFARAKFQPGVDKVRSFLKSLNLKAKLPSIAQIARDSGAATETVRKVLFKMEREGLLKLERKGRGYPLKKRKHIKQRRSA